jgi:hypothetical protein
MAVTVELGHVAALTVALVLQLVLLAAPAFKLASWSVPVLFFLAHFVNDHKEHDGNSVY